MSRLLLWSSVFVVLAGVSALSAYEPAEPSPSTRAKSRNEKPDDSKPEDICLTRPGLAECRKSSPCDSSPAAAECQPPADKLQLAKNCRADRSLPYCCNESRGLQKCEEPVVTYRPPLPPLGAYSLPGACQALHDESAYQVTLEEGELLGDALGRLRAQSRGVGGVINVPWNTDTVQCDSLRNGGSRAVKALTLRGIPGPQGEQPRFYCRSIQRDGTVSAGGGTFVLSSNDLLVENIHIDGYGTAVSGLLSGHLVVRNNYVHHQTGNGFVNNLIPDNAKNPQAYKGALLEYCGNELSHAGNGNAKHGWYTHRCDLDDPECDVHLVAVDNLIHSMSWSSGLKSTANKNTIVGNKFYKFLDTDPTYSRMYSQMLLDIVACSQTLVEGNYFNRTNDDFGPGNAVIGIRGRRSIHGCNRPLGYTHAGKREHIPVADSKFWDPKYWASLEGRPVPELSWHIENNVFEIDPKSHKADTAEVMVDNGTYPAYEKRQFGRSCILAPPKNWFERHRTYVSGNTYKGFNYGNDGREKIYISWPQAYQADTDKKYMEACGTPIPQPDLRFELDSFFVIGPGEVFK